MPEYLILVKKVEIFLINI